MESADWLDNVPQTDDELKGPDIGDYHNLIYESLF